MSDLELKNRVIEEIDWEPSIDASDIGVTTSNGVVTLTGQISSFMEKTALERAVKRLKGVRAIAQEVEVRLPHEKIIDDAKIAERALQALAWDVSVPEDNVTVMVENGRVTLSGEVDWQYQREHAFNAVKTLTGVHDVNNHIAIKKQAQPADLRKRIEAALQRNASTEARRVEFSIDEGKVILTGKAHSWHERRLIEDAIWNAPGVLEVEDNMKIG